MSFSKLFSRQEALESQLKFGISKGNKLGLFFIDDGSLEVTPTEVIQDQEGSGKASDEISTAGLKKGNASKEVLIVSTAEVNLSTAGGTVTYSRRSAEENIKER
ncbi:hypothetical protein Tco_1318070 [Tanacetum coccineum]